MSKGMEHGLMQDIESRKADARDQEGTALKIAIAIVAVPWILVVVIAAYGLGRIVGNTWQDIAFSWILAATCVMAMILLPKVFSALLRGRMPRWLAMLIGFAMAFSLLGSAIYFWIVPLIKSVGLVISSIGNLLGVGTAEYLAKRMGLLGTKIDVKRLVS